MQQFRAVRYFGQLLRFDGNQLMSNSDKIALGAVLVSVISMLISVLTYYQNNSKSLLRREQIERMRTVAIRAAVLWDQIQTILAAAGYFPVDDYLFPSVQNNAKRLEEALDLAIGSGLIHEIMSKHPKALVLYTTFLQSLYFITSKLSSDELQEACLKDHFTLGMVRLLDRCILFSPKVFPDDFQKETAEFIVPRAEMAWGYLDKNGS